MKSFDPDTIYVESTVSSGSQQPNVLQRYRDSEVMFTAEQARERGAAILRAAAYAETEAAVFKTLIGINPKSKGFGEIPKKDLEMAAMMLQLVRDQREPLPQGIDCIFGFNTQKPIVVLEWNEVKLQLDLPEARHHALALLAAADAADSDAFLYQFMTGATDMELEEVGVLIQQFALYRQRRQLESMIG
ncbi:hypothetical protein G7B40_040115 [Aetokthonos hydrillicola Thurmond2011]|jgi:hypothetical protein|uniref:Uncharacterized protein n=1 Tax=Aetokthonos hydrillicola Thurmond2011 TaxID=2712845 RepID=A0AAP5MCV2_9CYAN|nr:hypothetical protein [Aetokthonos hydrillicola]MBO3459935.1 hypothetical protein [Aetokthonos hydrillicola CCALA 1050]MBW4584053.1 hypothetical protein [Aetokthonos hydrillicola CCALA 1050]MDR9900695.1 hypothetical protein [Aetokthonos hydrillicola Thurmond2011]